MVRMGHTLVALLGGAALFAGQPAFAQATAAPTRGAAVDGAALDALFEAAGRGDVGPVTRALAAPGSPEVRALLEARLALARLTPGLAADPRLRVLSESGDPAIRRAALAMVTQAAFADGDYAEAARAGRALEAALTSAGRAAEAAAAGRTASLAALLIGHPGQALEGAVAAATIPARIDRVGLPRIDIAVNGVAQDAVFDTGANLSVLSAETARRMGVTVMESETRVGNGVDGTVPVKIGIAARVEIAGTVLTNVPFLVIDDANLTFPLPGGYDIRAIVGLPAMRALGRFRMESADGRLVVQPPADPVVAGRPANLHADGTDLFVDVTMGGRAMALHLDTGANQTSLSALYAEANPEAVAALQTGEARLASAGGATQRQVATWANAPVGLAGRTLVLPQVPVSLPVAGERPRVYGTLGSNALRGFESYTIDFATMRLDLGAPVTAP